MKAFKIILYSLAAVFIISACSKDENETYDLRFIHIMHNEASTVTVSEKANAVGTYNIYLSAPQFLQPVTVTYKITAGAGLIEGRDYELLTSGTEVTFLPGIYDMPVRIKWLSNPVDISLDNSITIEITQVSNATYTIGLPGKDKLQRSLVITKIP